MGLLSTLFKGKSGLWKNIFKCALAYEIASIMILVPAVYKSAGSPPYVLVLGTLLFNAAGTAGNQIQQMMLSILVMIPTSIWCAVMVKFCTMYNRAVANGAHLYSNGSGFIGAFAYAICIYFVAYCRLKYPRFYLQGLQGYTLPFFVITQNLYKTDYSVMWTVRSFYPVLIGGCIALIVNLCIWPETAAKRAEHSMGTALESIKGVLIFVEEDLLKNDSSVVAGDVSASSKLQGLNSKLQKDIAAMATAHHDAAYEPIISYYALECYKPLHQSLKGLSQSLMSFSLTIKREVRIVLERKVKSHFGSLQKSSNFDHTSTKWANSRANTDPTTSDTLTVSSTDHRPASVLSGDTLFQGREYNDIDRLQQSIRPYLRKFLKTCILALDQVENQLIEHKAIAVENKSPQETHSASKIDLESALSEFREAEMILQREYDCSDCSPNEDRFLVFTVVFTLVELGKSLIQLQNDSQELIATKIDDGWIFSRIHLPHMDLSTWLSKGSTDRDERKVEERLILDNQGLEEEIQRQANINSKGPITASNRKKGNNMEIERQINRIVSRIEESPAINDLSNEVLEKNKKQVELEEVEVVPLQQVKGQHVWNKWLYHTHKYFQSAPTRYAIKFMLITLILAFIAFLPVNGIYDFYNQNHGQWCLLSAMIVYNYTVGSTALQCFYRIVATIMGAVAGYICLLAAQRNKDPYVLAVLILVFQVMFWYVLFGTKYPRLGFISILTLAVITATGYENNLHESLVQPLWKRIVTAIIAIVVVMLVDNLLWPVWARKRMRTSLSDLLIATGLQYCRVVSLVLKDDTNEYSYHTMLAEYNNKQKILLQQLQMVEQMLVLAAGEPRFTKGPFPVKEYKQLLEHERNVLHWISHIQKAQALITPAVRQTIMADISDYLKEMSSAVDVNLYTLACSLKTKSPLPATLPTAETARLKLQSKQALNWKKNYEILGRISTSRQTVEHQMFWHTYAAGTTEIIMEQEAMESIVARLMGQHMFEPISKEE